jgi:hypothetical protein
MISIRSIRGRIAQSIRKVTVDSFRGSRNHSALTVRQVHFVLLLTAGLALVGGTASAATVPIVSYDVAQTPGSGFGCWSHNYTGTMVDTGHTVSGSVICTPDGGHVFNYSAGSGTLNDGLVDTTHLLLTRTDDQGQVLQPVITLHLERVVTVSQIRLLKGNNSFTCIAGAAVEINGTTVPFPSPTPIGGDCRSVVIDLGPTALAVVPTSQITVKSFSASFFGSPIDQFGIGEVEVDGTDVILSPTAKDQCKDNGWKAYEGPNGPFKNQGDCIQFVNTGK